VFPQLIEQCLETSPCPKVRMDGVGSRSRNCDAASSVLAKTICEFLRFTVIQYLNRSGFCQNKSFPSMQNPKIEGSTKQLQPRHLTTSRGKKGGILWR